MSYTIIDCEQRSDAWYAARAGRLTGSVADAMLATIKSGAFSAERKHLRMKLALERITGRSQEKQFTTAPVQRGIDCEPLATGRYEAETGELLERVGFLSLGPVMAGCSLDAFVSGRKGIVEVKCPESATHLEYISTSTIPVEYRRQCIHNMWVSGAEYCDFISFDDRFPEDLQYLCIRVNRDEAEIQKYEKDVMKFLAEVSVEVDAINKLRKAA